MRPPTVSTTSSRALLLACRELGLDQDSLLAAACLTVAEVEDPDGRLPVERVGKLWNAAFESSGDDSLGLRIARAVPFGAYRVIDFLAASAPTVGESLKRVARYFPLINSAIGWSIDTADDRVRMRLSPIDATKPTLDMPRAYTEFALAVTVLHCRHSTGIHWPLIDVTFPFDPPASTALHETTFGCAIRFGTSHASFSVAADTWRMPHRSASVDLLQTLEAHASRLMDDIGATRQATLRVTQAIVDELEGGDPTLATVARRLAMSPRTLQRRLDDEGTSFAEVLDRTRQQIAKSYVADRGLALTEVAFLLGFSEPSAFTRAWQRWFGQSPRAYRAQLTAAAR
ncbi:MAG: HTH-type transcriptional regulator VirS [Acidimicrobiia bacterium]